MKMKKLLAVTLSAAMTMAMLAGCGGSNAAAPAATDAAAPAATEAAAPAAQAGKFTFETKGTVVAMKADAAPILDALGEPKSYTEETSCAFDGLDKNYVYTSYTITTYPDGDKDKINSLTLMDDTVSTSDKISIGDSKEKVEAAYGADGFNGVNAYVMKEGEAQLTIIMDGDKVSSIQYAAIFE